MLKMLLPNLADVVAGTSTTSWEDLSAEALALMGGQGLQMEVGGETLWALGEVCVASKMRLVSG